METQPTKENKSLKRKWIFLIVLVLLIAGSLFYWYEYRPTQIIRNCNKKAMKSVMDTNMDIYDEVYSICLRDHGIEK